MFDVDIKNLLIENMEWDFIGEIVVRTAIMFLMILFVLRLSGKRGVRQLTLFEVAIILGLGSAAGDPMFQEDVPIFHAVVVFAVVMAIYKTLTWLASKSLSIHRALEGQEMIVVKNGMFNIKNDMDNEFSTMEFFTELRNQSVEHLGQIRTAILETDGTMSVLFYADQDVQFGLPLFPEAYQEADLSRSTGVLACMRCGCLQQHETILKNAVCPRCKENKWAMASNTTRIA